MNENKKYIDMVLQLIDRENDEQDNILLKLTSEQRRVAEVLCYYISDFLNRSDFYVRIKDSSKDEFLTIEEIEENEDYKQWQKNKYDY